MSGARNSEVADWLIAHRYSLTGFGPVQCHEIDGKRVLVSASRKQNLCIFLAHRAARVMQLDAARVSYPWLFA